MSATALQCSLKSRARESQEGQYEPGIAEASQGEAKSAKESQKEPKKKSQRSKEEGHREPE